MAVGGSGDVSVGFGVGVGVSPGVPVSPGATTVSVRPGVASFGAGVRVPGVTVKLLTTVGLPGNGLPGVLDATTTGDTVPLGTADGVSNGTKVGSATIRGAINNWVGVGSSVGVGTTVPSGRCLVGVGDGVAVMNTTSFCGALVGDGVKVGSSDGSLITNWGAGRGVGATAR
ncbi:MAG TPA: hypothetical protein VMP10_05515 [Chloroflexota bacterium]|nr:hypothetical protein [Chloroflexota bacterium]